MPMNPGEKTTEELFDEGTELDQALEQAAREAYLLHKRLGRPVIAWENGQIVEIPPEQIEVDPPPIGPVNGDDPPARC